MYRCRMLLDYRSSKIGDEFGNFISRNPSYDHVAIDVGALAGAAGRMTRDLLGADRDHETVKYMGKTMFNSVLRRVQAKKSVAFLMDGSDPVWKTRKSRKYPGKKFEGKFYRSCASPAMYMVEERLRNGAFKDLKMPPPEIVVSGPGVLGPVESKLSGWMLDLASRKDVSRNDSIAIIGGSDLVMAALGATPFHNITNLQFNQDWRSLALQDTLEWLNIEHILKDGDNVKLARARTDIVFLMLMGGGLTTTDLPTLGLGFKELMEAYTDNISNSEFLFSEEGNDLMLDVSVLEKFLSRASRRTHPARDHAAASDYLEILLQTHTMLCNGGIRNYGYFPKEPLVEKPVPVRVEQLLGILKRMGNKKIKASENFDFGLTGAEALLVSAPTPDLIDQIIPAYTGGHALPPGSSEQLTNCENMEEAVKMAKDILSKGDRTTHIAMDFQPSHCFVRKPGEKGPPAGHKFFPINLGVRSFDMQTRSSLNSETSTEAVVAENVKNAMIVFDELSGAWVAKPCANLQQPTTYPSTFKTITWNVQFNRHSNEKTPLGKPGIDWCSETRYIALADILSKEDADVIAMQEVESPWWQYLTSQQWVREKYYISTLDKGEAITPWGVMLLVKKSLQIRSITNENVAGFTGHTSVMPIVTLGLKPRVGVSVGSFHLLAPYSQNNISNRTTQVANLEKRLKPGSGVYGDDCIAMGDFNDYPEQFYQLPPELNLGDAWTEVRGEDNGDGSGYTINGKVSEYTNLIIEPEYFGRADRMFYRSKHLHPKEAKLIGNISVKSHFGDDLQAKIGTKKCPDYLFPSDHFGCSVTFDLK